MCESDYFGFDLRHSFENCSNQRTNYNTAVLGPFSMLSRVLGQVVQKPINTNPRLKVNQGFNFSCIQVFLLLMFCGDCD